MKGFDKIILVRHGQSKEDVDPNLHNIDDEELGLTKKGVEQIINSTKKILDQISTKVSSIQTIYSPYRRTRESMEIFLKELIKNKIYNKKEITTKIEPSIRSIDWGDTNEYNKEIIAKKRYEAGVLKYQFPNGDYMPDYVNNIGKFVEESLVNDFDNQMKIIFTHGFPLRVIAKFLLNMSDEEFKYLANPQNGYFAVFERNVDDISKFILKTDLPRINKNDIKWS